MRRNKEHPLLDNYRNKKLRCINPTRFIFNAEITRAGSGQYWLRIFFTTGNNDAFLKSSELAAKQHYARKYQSPKKGFNPPQWKFMPIP